MHYLKWLILGVALTLVNTARAQEITAYTELLTPYQILDENNQISGFSTAVIKALAAKVNDTVNIQVLPWERAYRDVQQNNNTLIFSIYRAQAREKQFKWVGKLDDNIHYFYALKSNLSTHIKTEKQSKDLITAVIQNSYEEQALTDRGYKNLMPVSSEKQVVNMLFSQRIDLLFGSEVTIANLVTQAGKSTDDIVKLLPITQWGGGMYVAFNKDSDANIVDKYQRAYQELLNEGVIDEIKKAHFKFAYIK